MIMNQDNDTYLTISKSSEGYFKGRGSKFLAFAYPVNNEDEIKEKIIALKKQYHDARHYCYAYILGQGMDVQRVNDDGEPSNSAGKPILNQIIANNLTNTLIVVIRYFGGTLLGIGGLINAYKTAAAEALKNTSIISKTIDNHYKLIYDYPVTNEVMRILIDNNLKQLNPQFDTQCSAKIAIQRTNSEQVLEKLKQIKSVTIEYLKTQ